MRYTALDSPSDWEDLPSDVQRSFHPLELDLRAFASR